MAIPQFLEDVRKTLYEKDLYELASQVKSRALPYVDIKPFSGNRMSGDRIGQVEAVDASELGGVLTGGSILMDNRSVQTKRSAAVIDIDMKQVRNGDYDMSLLTDITKKCKEALYRDMDRLIMSAAFADVRTGNDFSNTVTFAQDGGITIDATSGIDYATILSITGQLEAYEVNTDGMTPVALFHSSEESQEFKNISEVINNNFITNVSRNNSVIKNIDGMDLINYGASVTNPILNVTSNVRDCLVMAKSAMNFYISKNVLVDIEKVPRTLETYSIKVWMDIGARRNEGVKMIKLQTAASA